MAKLRDRRGELKALGITIRFLFIRPRLKILLPAIACLTIFVLYNPTVEAPQKPPEASQRDEKVEEIPKTVVEQIEHFCELYEADCLLSKNIAFCESNYVPTAKNPSSTAKGIFQFIDSTWKNNCEGDVLNSVDNIECGVRLISEEQIGHWSASFNCWKYLPTK